MSLAHSTLPGAGSFLNGLVHPLSVPAHALFLVAAGLLISQRIPFRLREPMAAVGVGVALGLVLTTWLPESEAVRVTLTGWTCLVGLAVVADWPRPRVVRAVLVGVGALLIGLDSKPEAGLIGATVLTLFGIGAAVTLVVANAAFYLSLRPERGWANVGLRVIASWITAIALMSLAIAFR